MIVPNYGSIQEFRIVEVPLTIYDEPLFNTTKRYEIIFNVDGIEEIEEVEIEDTISDMRDYLGFPKTTKLHVSFNTN